MAAMVVAMEGSAVTGSAVAVDLADGVSARAALAAAVKRWASFKIAASA
jgi:hypothetical protein